MRKRIVGTVAAGLAVSVMGFTTTAAHADDTQVLIDNLPATVDALVSGVQETVDTAASTQSAVQTSAALGQAVVDAGSALVQGTEQFGALGLGFMLLNGTTQNALAPYLNAIDDPSTIADLVNPEDLSTLLENLSPAIDAAQPEAVTGLVHLLEGDLYNGAGFSSVALINGLGALTMGTNYEMTWTPLGVVLLVGPIAGGPYLEDLAEALAPVFEAAAPVTAPIIEALQGL